MFLLHEKYICNSQLSRLWKFIDVTLKTAPHSSQETHYVSATKPNRLMLFGETVAVYCENQNEIYKYISFGKFRVFFTLKHVHIYLPLCFEWLSCGRVVCDLAGHRVRKFCVLDPVLNGVEGMLLRSATGSANNLSA
jgi:hypothetical protein